MAPRCVLAHLRKHPASGLSAAAGRAEAHDALILLRATWWHAATREHTWITAGLQLGLPAAQLGTTLGLGTRRSRGPGDAGEALRARHARLQALLAAPAPTEEAHRRGSGPAAAAAARHHWLASHQTALHALAEQLPRAAHRYHAHGPGLRALAAGPPPAGAELLTQLGLASDELRTAPAVTGLTSPHGVHRLLRRLDHLRCGYTAAGTGPHWTHTPPAASDVTALVDQLHRNRVKADAPRLERFPDPEQTAPEDVLTHLHQARAVPRWVRQAEVPAALQLHTHLWWATRHEEHAWLRHVRQRGVFLTQIGAAWGISTRKGVLDRIDRLTALTTVGHLDHTLARDTRHRAQADHTHRQHQQQWIHDHWTQLTALSARLTAAADHLALADDAREWVDQLATDLRHGDLSPASLTTALRYAPAEVAAVLRPADQKHVEQVSSSVANLCQI